MNLDILWLGTADADPGFLQQAGDPLGTVSGRNFTLGTSMLATATVVERFIEADGVGEFRQIQYRVQNDIVGEDAEIHGFGAMIEPGGVSTENV